MKDPLPRPDVIDAHVHLRGGKRVPIEVMRRAGIRHMVNINYMSEGDAAQTRAFGAALDRDTESRGTAFLPCTTFPLAGFGEAGFADQAVALLEERFADHPRTVAVKLWKNVGLELRDRTGSLVQCDDPRFDPVFVWLELCSDGTFFHDFFWCANLGVLFQRARTRKLRFNGGDGRQWRAKTWCRIALDRRVRNADCDRFGACFVAHRKGRVPVRIAD